MAYQKVVLGLLALQFCANAATAVPTTIHYLNTTISTTSTMTTTSISLDPPSIPTDIISASGDDFPPHSDIGEDIPMSGPDPVLEAGPTASISEPATSVAIPSISITGVSGQADGDGPFIDPTLEPEPPSPSDDPGNFAAPGSSIDSSDDSDVDTDAPEDDINFEPGMDGIDVEGDDENGGKWDPSKTNSTDDAFGPSDALIDDNTPAFLEDGTGSTIGLSDDTPPAVIVDDEGVLISVPPLDATDPLDDSPPIIIPNPLPGQTVSIAHTLPGRVTSLSTGLGVVLPGSTMVPTDPFLPSLTGSITVISSTTFVIVSNPTTVALSIPRSTHTTGPTVSLPGRLTSISGTLDVVLPGSTTVPVNSYLPDLKGSTTIIGSSTFVVLSEPTTIAVSLPRPVNHITTPLPGRTTLISGTLNVVLPGSTTIPVNAQLSGLNGRTTIIGSETFVVIADPTTVPVNVVTTRPEYPAGTPGDIEPTGPFGGDPKSIGSRNWVGKREVLVCLLGFVFVLGMW
ncbi:hypothetical protein IFR05_014415 [Cadophora sp. M221]|nr:hypothetical protein IFR05_014415 [Cadophora sp. M221]